MRFFPSAANLSALIFRGNRAFFAYGGIYIRSEDATKSVMGAVRIAIPNPPKGVAFVRWGLGSHKKGGIAILISGVGRFGNSIAQVLNSVHLAQVLSATDVLFHRFNAIGNVTLPLGGGRKLRRVKFFPQRGFAPPRVIWRTYAITPEILFCEPWSDSMLETRNALGVATNIVMRSERWSDPDRLTIYVRGGDVFDQEPEEYYGQPPWVFYESVLEHRQWSGVNLVSEDSRNPVVDEIVRWCERQGLPVARLGVTLGEAIDVLKSAEHVVNARGTFVPAIIFLSGLARTVYHFGPELSGFLLSERISIYAVEDTDGSYTASLLSANWRNTEEQRGLMLSYPRESVSKLRKVS